jgi:hypothetical protein
MSDYLDTFLSIGQLHIDLYIILYPVEGSYLAACISLKSNAGHLATRISCIQWRELSIYPYILLYPSGRQLSGYPVLSCMYAEEGNCLVTCIFSCILWRAAIWLSVYSPVSCGGQLSGYLYILLYPVEGSYLATCIFSCIQWRAAIWLPVYSLEC